MHKMINLTDKKNTVTIKVEDQEFLISRITLKARQVYGEYCIAASNYISAVKEAEKVHTMNADELKRLNDRLEKGIDEFTNKRAEYIETLMKIILEKNGYEFDKEWWFDNADYGDMEAFVVEALRKDEDAGDKKKEQLVS